MARQQRQQAVVVSDSAFNDIENELPAGFNNPNDPNNGQALTPHNPLTLAESRLQEDRELAEMSVRVEKETNEINQLDAAIEEFPDSEDSDAYVDIYRHPSGGGGMEWMHRATMSQWREMRQPWIARQFGAGKYEVFMYRGGGRGLYKRPKAVISRDGAELQKKLWLKDNPAEVAAPAAPSVGGSGTERLAQVMIQGFTQLGQLIAAQKTGGGDDAEEKFLKRMAMYRDIFAPAHVQQQAPAGNTLETAIKIAGLIHPGAAEKSTLETFAEIAKEFAPGLIEMARSAMPAQQPQAAQPRLAGPSARPSNPEGAERVNGIQNAIIKAQLKTLISKAEKDSDPELYAEVIYDNLENIPGELITRFLNDPEWMKWLAGFDTRVLEHPDWFTDLYTSLRKIIEDEAAKQGNENLTPANGAVIPPASIHMAGGDVLHGSDSDESGESDDIPE